ncbi:DHA2 family efflux MFS transporter permease subunit [Micromonospora sp. HM5-17]|jgi:EmrB/QacA subfamily drug resistance transporter|uniref:DHA2 family efflux MFS transporter permease subunit n=1 Tax=Micromonospora sp. HM5-17 TaxID=2487710 RepID=UPI000F4814EC|nr:DHA2 family efflux MFS transporter permease subunit [Micromonospora sp. HM5-17]ROT33843.1 DHA2 family efflux MFS transporter permease subunit [Micromonospora sp. HM5-17]
MTQARDDRLDPALLRLVGVVLLGGIMGILDGTMVAVAVDTLTARFDTAVSTIGWVSTGYLLALTATIPVTTWAVDRFGARRLWLFGLLLFLSGSLASGLAWNVASLIVFRLAQGVGAGILDPLVLTLLARAAGPARAGRVMGLMGAVLPLGPVLGPVVGGIVLDTLNWRWMFLVNLPIGAVAFLLALRVVPVDSPAEEQPQSRLDVLGLALSGPGAAALILALTQVAQTGRFLAGPVLLPLVLGAALLVAYVVHALRVRDVPPLIDVRLFRSRSFSASVTVQGLVGVASFSILFVLPLYYQQMQGAGDGAFVAGLLVAPMGLGSVLAMPVAGRLSDRLGARGLALGGAVVAALSALAFTRIDADTHPVWSGLAAFVIGGGLGFVGAPTMGSLYRTLPGHLVPQGSSVLYMLNQLGASIGIAVVAVIVDVAGQDDPMRGFHGVYWWVFATVLVILAGSALLPGRPEEAAATPADPADPAAVPTTAH